MYIFYTSCTKRKKHKPQSILNRDDNLISLEDWLVNKNNQSLPRYKAKNLYCGELWTNVLKINEKVEDTYIISAGLGLINIEDEIPSYAITYCHQNFKVNTIKQPEIWWEALCQDNEFSIQDNVKKYPDKIHIFAVGGTYFQAIAKTIPNHPNVWIVTSKNKESEKYEDKCIFTSVNFRYATGGSDVTINTRAAKTIIENKITNIENARQLISSIENGGRHKTRPIRRRYTDEQMLKVITKVKEKKPDISYTMLLTLLRKNNIACQDARLSRLFQTIC